MSEYNWCHGTHCHEIETQSRIRGSGDNKVLRTRKIALNSEWIRNSIWQYFCNQNCLMMFLNKFGQEIANTYSVKQPSETPIKVETKTYNAPDHPYYNGRKYKEIKVLNE